MDLSIKNTQVKMNYRYLHVCIWCISQVDCYYLIFRRFLRIKISVLFVSDSC